MKKLLTILLVTVLGACLAKADSVSTAQATAISKSEALKATNSLSGALTPAIAAKAPTNNPAIFNGTNFGLLTVTNADGMTNSKVALVDGGIHLPSAIFGGSYPVAHATNYNGGAISWWDMGTAFPVS